MLKLLVTPPAGAQTVVEAQDGLSVMEIIRDAGFESLPAFCGGCCSCATCHVYVDPAFAALLPPISDDEDALLDGAEQRRPTSRLSCQIALGPALDGLVVEIAPDLG
ncbi:2Fe-2S iron-sulfur cluster-binding protein [Sphingomonas sp. TDK1]|uniref:2Fe-2S iron-sulfur cluster-binding protein n=1 Tax=Sphingomonas sp. TDK1 TaxID=453247 RepID=UPI0007D905F1|nr:2Fe-2S iron-sulfur cluster-binding protein [Sphingomonas sp. TDK1]OAN58454.1 ferredoxin [Sphingomonas sp. TDK1]